MANRRQVVAGGAAFAATPAAAAPVQVSAGGLVRLTGATPFGMERVTTVASREAGVTILGVEAGRGTVAADGEIGIRFASMPTIDTGIQIWRYAPWKAWTRPLAIRSPADLRADDVQLIVWRERDGSYVVAVPLSGAGFRTTLGQVEGQLAVRAAPGASAPAPPALPLLAIGHGTDPHAVIAATYRAALAVMNRSSTGIAGKTLPEPLTYLGWCSWNASDLGKKLDETLVRNAASELRAAGVAIGWLLFDDGYFDHREQRLRSFAPDRAKFPRGFAPIIAELKRDYGVRYVGAWLALNGYWHGLDPASLLGQAYAADLFTWNERTEVIDQNSAIRTNSFIRPDRPSTQSYYDAHLGALRKAGLDFVKVDNQLVVERMARGNFPVWQLAEAMHRGKNAAVKKHFNNAVINCMDLTADAYFNLGTTSVARAVEDYFPYKPGENYDLEKGNAAAHVLQALYNALYVGQLAFPDFDMFETANPNARLHAVARAANSGPIYVTDLPGEHDVALLKSMTLADGRSLRADAPLVPCVDCLFQLQEAKPFKAFSRVGGAGLLAVFNLADAEHVTGTFRAADVPGFGTGEVVAYEHLTRHLRRIAPGVSTPVSLPRFGSELWSLHRAEAGFAAFGRSDKINGLAAIASVQATGNGQAIALHEVGPTAAWSAKRPVAVRLAGEDVPFTWTDGLLSIDAPETRAPGTLMIEGTRAWR